ncbi:transcriptional regulator NrdR [Pontiella sp.]|uniref:transcriptional regulator NrdR n=1 Tax=Pontiella sp. TaxID=2837462 RepID=UPI003566F9FB
MRCPKCEDRENRVIDSREVRNGDAIRRRRVCVGCGHRFTTYEEVQRAQLQVTKRDGRREELNRGKLVKSLDIACRKRHISVEQIERLADAIVMEAESEFEKEIPSITLGLKVMAALEKLDEVAYIRYASVYRRFRDAGQFMNEVERLIGRE